MTDSAGKTFFLEGRVAVITGAAHGIGRAMASAFARAGVGTALLDVNIAEAEVIADEIGQHAKSIGLSADVRKDDEIEPAIASVVENFGRLDIVVNNAGIYPEIPFSETTSEDFLNIMDTNFGGTFRVTRAALPTLSERGVGRVINLASVMAFTGLPIGRGAYVASKSAIIGLTRALARELGPAGITVNAIAPGAIPVRPETDSLEEQARIDALILERQSVQRRGTVDDIANAALFLASDAASFISGQTLLVDGGWAFA